jgi:PKD repeat protein
MKKLLIVFVLTVAVSSLFAATGFDVTFQQPEKGTYELYFDLGNYSLTEVTIDGNTWSKILFEGSVSTNLKGFAELPFLNASVGLSPDKNVTIEITEGDFQDYILNTPLLPSRGVIYRNQDPSSIPYEISPSSLRDNWYPQNLAVSTDPYIIKDVRGTTVYVYPFRYNAVQNVLRVYKNIKVTLVENETKPYNPMPNSTKVVLREMNALYQSLFINYNLTKDLTIGEYGDILVVCTSRDETAIQPYIDWKLEKGFNVEKILVATGTNVKTTIQNAYTANNNILYVQLIGDWADIKSDIGTSQSAPMDPQLGCVVGSDQVPDICIGRFSASSAAQVTIQVDKVINYEKFPEMGETWYKGALGIGSDQGSGIGDDGEMDKTHIQVIWDDRLDPFTYDNYFTAYDPGASTTQVSTAVNTGISVLNYCGHGSPTSWGTTGFSNNNVNALTNGTKLPVIFSVACNNGNFHDPTDCFAEAWLKKTGGGAVMFLGGTISQPWDPPMRGEDYFDDMLIGGYDYTVHPGQSGISSTEGRTTIGAIVFNGLVLMTTESGQTDDWETAKTWTLFGDPSMQMRTDTPGDLVISNNIILVGIPFTTTITGNGSPVEGAMVCLSQSGTYFRGITDATGSVSITNTLTPGTAKLVITALNMETIYEDVTVVPPGGPWVTVNSFSVDDAGGNGNGQADYGETVQLDVTAENVGSAIADNVTAILSSSDPYLTITDDSFTFGNIAAGGNSIGDNAFEIAIADDVPDGYLAMMEIEFTGNEKTTWTSTVSIVLHAPVMELGEYTINDNSGNNNGKIDPGETVTILIEITNGGTSDAYNVEGTLSCIDPFVTINAANQDYGDITAGGNMQKPFSVTANIATPAGHQVTFNLLISGDMNLSATGSFMEVIGQIPVLIIDLDANNNSAPAMLDAMANNDLVAEYSTSIPADLSLYNCIFLCLGVYSDNYVLTSSEGQVLADFLNNGGKLYMEGGDTWAYDTQTAVHAMFNINGAEDGNSDLGTINGKTGTFTEGMSFSYSGENSWIDHLETMGSSFIILENQSPVYGTGIAYDGGTYKTIGCSHEFGGLTGGPSTQQELMAAYLQFFGFTSTLQAMFMASDNEICEGETVDFYDMSTGGAISWEWTFEGGDPATSTDQNPTVSYTSAGVYDVTLTVSDGTEYVTLTVMNYITVDICSGIKDNNATEISIYPNPNYGIFTIGLNSATGENTSLRVVNPLGGVEYSMDNINTLNNNLLNLNLTNLNKGLYFLIIGNDQSKTVKKIIIE